MSSRPLVLAIHLAVSAVALSAGGCSSALEVHSATAPTAQLERHRTFVFDQAAAPPANYASSTRSAEVRNHIEESVQAILLSRGYELSTGRSADLAVRIETGRRPQSTAQEAPLPPPEQTEIPYYGFLDDEQRDLVEGSFVIDAFDGETHRLLWHGSAREVIDPTRANYDRLQRAVEKVMASFPARIAARP